jgi:uncharacterized protein
MDSDAAQEKLDLADWRRRVAELYVGVRELAATDPRAAWDRWRAERERLFREHPSSPLQPESRPGFAALHFDYDPALRFEVPVVAEAEVAAAALDARAAGDVPAATTAAPSATAPAPAGRLASLAGLGLALPVSVGRPISFERLGWLEVPFESGPARLALFWLPEYSGGLFLPFRDATNGSETYGGGRYLLDTAKSADLGGDPSRRTVILDFNFAYQPSCAFDPRWSCPLSPPENRLSIRIRAGERIR